MKTLRLWQIKIQFQDQSEIRHVVKGEVLRMGRSPKCEYRHELFKNDIELEVSDLGIEKERHLDFGFATFRISELSAERFEAYDSQWKRLNQEDIDFADQSPVLWHFHKKLLLGSYLLEDFQGGKVLSTGSILNWDKENPFQVLLQVSDDLRTLEFEKDQGTSYQVSYGDDRFLLTKSSDFQKLSQLDSVDALEMDKERTPFRRTLLTALLSWIVFVFLFNMVSQMLPEEVVEEQLSTEMAKVSIEKAQGKKDKGGGNGQAGGGGVEHITENDPRGGSGAGPEEILVSDKALFGSAKIMSALSQLDEGMNTGKVAMAGVAAMNVPRGSNAGILGALASLTGKGGGKNGLGLGGLGTKGLGGGGGGGKGSGFGTGVGSGLGKGEGLRNISFDNDAASIRGGLEKSEVDAVVKENFSQVRYCYNRALRNNPQLQGKLVSNFVIGADGSVQVSRIKDSTLGVPEVESCVRSRVASWKFPKPRGGATVEVSYPFLLKAF